MRHQKNVAGADSNSLPYATYVRGSLSEVIVADSLVSVCVRSVFDNIDGAPAGFRLLPAGPDTSVYTPTFAESAASTAPLIYKRTFNPARRLEEETEVKVSWICHFEARCLPDTTIRVPDGSCPLHREPSRRNA